MLFYRRRSSGYLGGPRFAEILEKYEKESSQSDSENTESGEDGRGSTKTDIKELAEPEDEELPPYDSSIRRSIEGDGEDVPSNYQPLGSKSLNMTQGWSFNGLDGSGAEGSTAGDCGSDDAQFDSSGDDRGREFYEMETDTASAAAAEGSANWHDHGVLSVPAQAGSDGGSDDVAEIHLEGDKASRNQ